jgi:hypothetical protein
MVELCGRICISNFWDDAESLKGVLKKKTGLLIYCLDGQGKEMTVIFLHSIGIGSK